MSNLKVEAIVEPESKERLRLWLKMLRATRLVENALREKLRRAYGSTLPRFDVLSALERAPDGLRMSELSEKLMVSNGNVTGIVDRLVEDGLVERRQVVGDRRATRTCLTAQGRAAFAEMAAEHERWVEELLNGVSVEEIRTLIEALSRIGDGTS